MTERFALTGRGRRALGYRPGGACYEAFVDGMSMGAAQEKERLREEVIAEDGGNAYMVRGKAAQDLRDGAALRRLREALPRAVRVQVVFDPARYSDQVVVSTPDYVALGQTLAEAADKCREALG